MGDRREFTEEEKKEQLDQLYQIIALKFQMTDFVTIQPEDETVCCEYRIDKSEIHEILEQYFDFIYGHWTLNSVSEDEAWYFVRVLPKHVKIKYNTMVNGGKE